MKLTFLQRFLVKSEYRRKLYGALSKVASDGKSWYSALEIMGAEFARTKHPAGLLAVMGFKHPLAPLAKIVLLRMRGAGKTKPGHARRTLGSELAGMVPADEAMLIQAGEASGQMAAGLGNAAELVQSKGRLKKAVLSSLRDPVGYFIALMAVLVYISTSLLPQFEKSKPRAAWTDDAQLLGIVSDNVGLIVGGSVAVLIAAAAALQWVVPRWTGKLRALADIHVFPFPLIAEINGAAFLTTLAGYIASGTPFSEAVKNVSMTATPYMQDQCGRVMDLMRRGRRPEEALCQLPIIPQKYHWIIKVYAMSEDAAKVYEDIAEELTNSVEEFVNALFGHVATAMKFGVGLMIIWIYGALNDIATSSAPV